MKRAVKWGKAVPRTIGKSNLVSDDEFIRTSKCGKFRIEKRMMCGGRNGYFTNPMYTLIIVATGERSNYDTLIEAKDFAEFEVNPDWEPDSDIEPATLRADAPA